MAEYRIPVWRDHVTVNGRVYHASGNGVFIPDNDADAAEMRILGGVVDVWEDLRFPANGINPIGSAADATRDTTTGLLSFAGNADNLIAGQAQMPHAWKVGSTIRPHVHLIFPTAASSKNTRWKFEYSRANINGDFENNYGSYTVLDTITVANPNNAKKSVVASFGDLTMSGYGISAAVLWRITRLADTDEADNDTGACVLSDFDIHYQTDGTGSRLEFVK